MYTDPQTGSHSHHKKSAAAAAAAAKASAAEATAAAQQMASRAAQHAKVADKAAAEAQQGEIPANSLIPEAPVDSGSEDGILPDLPSISELKSVATACFGADSDAEASTAAAAGKRAGKEAEAAAEGEDDSEEGLLEKLLPSFGKDSCLRKKTSQLVPTFRSGRQKAKPKPLRLKLAEQVCLSAHPNIVLVWLSGCTACAALQVMDSMQRQPLTVGPPPLFNLKP